MKKNIYLTLTLMSTCIIWIGCTNSISSNPSSYEVLSNNYASGTVCGGSIMSYGNKVYRSYDGGIAPLKSNLDKV